MLDEILPEAFATVREAARRLVGTTVIVTGRELTWDMVHYDVQLMGGIQLHLGKIAEMATGEGKTLVATLPLYLNALPGKGAHLVTVNSYLARRDSQWMGHLYNYLGLTVGCLDDTEPGTLERRAAYFADITYGTNNEFGFDYLRDNMVVSLDQRVQRPHVVRDRRRSGLGVDRRSANAAHHLGSGRQRQRRDVLRAQRRGCAPRAPPDGARQHARRRSGAGAREGRHAAAARAAVQGAARHPKNRRLMKMMQEPGNKQLVQKMELEHIADRRLPASKQQYRDIEDDLLFVLDEKGHSVHLTDQGVEFMSPNEHDAFVLPDISQEVHRIDHDHDLTAEEKIEARRADRDRVRGEVRAAEHRAPAAARARAV